MRLFRISLKCVLDFFVRESFTVEITVIRNIILNIDYGNTLKIENDIRKAAPYLWHQNYQCLKNFRSVYCVLSVLTYGTETWSLTVCFIKSLKVIQRAMERAMLAVSLLDRIWNEKIRKRTEVHSPKKCETEVMCARNIGRTTDGWRALRVLEWWPRTERRHGPFSTSGGHRSLWQFLRSMSSKGRLPAEMMMVYVMCTVVTDK